MAMQKVLTTVTSWASSVAPLHGLSGHGQDSFCGGGFMTQWIDHSDHSKGTFQQQIQVITDYFKPGGPIIFFQGEESSEMICVETTILADYARELGGIAAAIEHRYFGMSAPFGPDESYTRDGFKYLTLDNVMDDTARFVRQIQANVTGAAHSPAIAASGSYGALITTALRINRPEEVYGAISAATPARGFVTESGRNSIRFELWDWISNVISDKSAEAAAAIKRAFAILQEDIERGNFAGLQRKLDLCETPEGPEDAEKIIALTSMVYMLSTEFNYAYASPGRNPIALPLDRLINTVLEHKSDPYELLKSAAFMWFRALDPSMSCLSLDTSEGAAVPLIQWVPWMYIMCSYVGIDVQSVSPDSIFIPRDPDVFGQDSFCESEFGIKPMTYFELRERYNLTQTAYELTERNIYSVGQWDPITVLSPPHLPATADRNASKILYVSNMAHREELFAANPADRPEVIRARQIEVETIKGWLGMT